MWEEGRSGGIFIVRLLAGWIPPPPGGPIPRNNRGKDAIESPDKHIGWGGGEGTVQAGGTSYLHEQSYLCSCHADLCHWPFKEIGAFFDEEERLR